MYVNVKCHCDPTFLLNLVKKKLMDQLAAFGGSSVSVSVGVGCVHSISKVCVLQVWWWGFPNKRGVVEESGACGCRFSCFVDYVFPYVYVGLLGLLGLMHLSSYWWLWL